MAGCSGLQTLDPTWVIAQLWDHQGLGLRSWLSVRTALGSDLVSGEYTNTYLIRFCGN